VRRRGTVALIVLVACLAFAAVAIAGEITTAPTGDRFSASEFTIDQGEKTTFRNTDLRVSHDVVSNQTEGGKPLFRSEIVPAGSSGPVEGTEFLVTGRYPFRCTLHPGMEATLVVTANGTPAPKPGTPPSPTSPGDTTPAEGKVAIADRRVTAVRRRKALRVRASSNEEAKFAFTAKSGRTTIARGSTTVTDSKTVSLRLTRAGRRLVARARTLKVKVTAKVTDTVGNTSSASASRTLR